MKNDILEGWFERQQAAMRGRWKQFLRFGSIASEPGRVEDCLRCAEWLRDRLLEIGFRAHLQSTPCGPPLVMGEFDGTVPRAPTVLLYGHYDVQPVDPVEGWSQPDPFEPVERGDRVYARGAQDNKGQLLFAIEAIRALIEQGGRLPRIRIVVEGEEECGSRGLAAVLRTDPAAFASDVLLVCDTASAADGRPAVVAGLRGMVQWQAVVRGARRDLHSGQHGGLAPNPVQVLARLVASLHDDRGRIAVEGFYDGLLEPTLPERVAALEQPFDPVRYIEATGVEPVGGEQGLDPRLRLGFQPTLEVNGLHGGYGGPGVKTIIPAEAEVKLSARLCPDQRPDVCHAALERHWQARIPAGVTFQLTRLEPGLPGLRLPLDSPLMRRARAVLGRLDPRGSTVIWEGASIPIITALRDATGAQPLLVGFGREEDRIHATDESYSWEQARLGFRFASAMLEDLAVSLGPSDC